MLAVFAVVGALGGCVADDESTSAAPRSEATLTIRREMPAGPIWEEGSTMVVRVFEERRLVHEVQAGDGYYEPDVAVISLPPGTYRVHVGQTGCVETCRSSMRDPERATCEREVEIGDRSVELVAEVPDRFGCELEAA